MVDEYLHLCNGGELIPIKLSEEMAEFFSKLAKEKGITLAGFISHIIPEALALLEDDLKNDKSL